MRSFTFFAVLALLSATAQAEPLAKTITVTGIATLDVKPDKATINIGVETADKVTAKAMAANSVLMARVVEAIKSVGIPTSAMQTSNFSIEAQHPILKDGYSPDMTVTTGYAVSNILTIGVDEIDKVGQVIDAAVRAGANSSNSVRFTSRNGDAYNDKVLTEAMKAARHKAQVLADAEGARVGKMISAEANNDRYGVSNIIAGNTNAAPGYAPTVMPGEVTVTGIVTVVFTLE